MTENSTVSLPSLSDTINSIKSGAVFADVTAALSDVTSMASQLPQEFTAVFDSAVSSVTAAMSAAQANLPTLMSVASTQANVINMQSVSSTGQPATNTALSVACGALAIFRDGPAMLRAKLNEIIESIKGFAAGFNVSIEGLPGIEAAKKVAAAIKGTVSQISDLVKDVVTAVDQAAKDLAQAALDAFSAANAGLKSMYDSVAGAVQNAASGLVSGINGLVEQGKAAFRDAIKDIKAFAAGIQFSLPSATPCSSEAKAVALDQTKLTDPSKISGAVSVPAPTTDNVMTGPAALEGPEETLRKNPNIERVTKSELLKFKDQYVTPLFNEHVAEKNALFSTAEMDEYNAAKAESDRIIVDVPDPVDRTSDQQAKVDEFESIR